LGGLNIFWVISVNQHLASVLPGLGDFPANRVRELTPSGWSRQASSPVCLKPKSVCGEQAVVFVRRLESNEEPPVYLNSGPENRDRVSNSAWNGAA